MASISKCSYDDLSCEQYGDIEEWINYGTQYTLPYLVQKGPDNTFACGVEPSGDFVWCTQYPWLPQSHGELMCPRNSYIDGVKTRSIIQQLQQVDKKAYLDYNSKTTVTYSTPAAPEEFWLDSEKYIAL